MKILVTGAEGFIGRYLVPELRQSHEVVAVDHKHGDLVLPSTVFSFLSTHRPDVVVHLAAKTSRLLCEDDPRDTVFQNAVATLNVALACMQFRTKLVYASTSEVYGHQGDALMTEESPTNPPGIYALTKKWGEDAVKLYAPEGWLIMRLSMPYGPMQAPGRQSPVGRGRAAIINFLYQALHRQPMPVHVGAERSNCFVVDTVRAIRMLIEQGQTGVWNVGRDDDARPIIDIAKLACDMTGAPHDLIQLVPPPQVQVVVKRLSMQKIRSIGWKPEVSLEDGMKRVLEWVKTLPGP